MIDHVGFHAADFATSKAFYDAVFASLGGSLMMTVPPEHTGGKSLVGYGRDHPVFWLEGSPGGVPQHIAFSAQSRAQVDAFHAAALAAGGADNGAPGLRLEYSENYYAAFAFDPDGNNVEAVCHLPG